MAPITFDAKVRADGPGKAWYFAHLPRRASEALGSRGRVAVAGTIGGHPFRTSAFPNGDGTHHVAVNRAMREATGLGDGDTARFVLSVDARPRPLRLPPELRDALAARPPARAGFDRLAPSHRREYARWVAEAKRPGTRARRAREAAERCARGAKPEDA